MDKVYVLVETRKKEHGLPDFIHGVYDNVEDYEEAAKIVQENWARTNSGKVELLRHIEYLNKLPFDLAAYYASQESETKG